MTFKYIAVPAGTSECPIPCRVQIAQRVEQAGAGRRAPPAPLLGAAGAVGAQPPGGEGPVPVPVLAPAASAAAVQSQAAAAGPRSSLGGASRRSSPPPAPGGRAGVPPERGLSASAPRAPGVSVPECSRGAHSPGAGARGSARRVRGERRERRLRP